MGYLSSGTSPGSCSQLLLAARDASSLPERERERGFARERERDPAAPAPLPGHVNKEVEKTWPGNENEDHAA